MPNQRNAILTILICCYNGGEFLKKCLNSLTGQSVSSSFYQLLFINDASTDNSFEIAKTYSDKFKNYKILNNKKNKGLIKCCNNGIKNIATPYFVRLDADDWLSSDCVEKILKELNSFGDKDFIVFKRWDVLDDDLREVESDNDIYTWIAAGTVFNTEKVRAAGGYSEEYWEEYDLYIKLLEMGNKYRISLYRIYYYRRGHESMTQDYGNKKEGFESLSRKRGIETLEKYGNLEKALGYYGI